MEQKCSGLQQRKNLLTQRSNVANAKAITCFFFIFQLYQLMYSQAHNGYASIGSTIQYYSNKTFLPLKGHDWGAVNNHVQ